MDGRDVVTLVLVALVLVWMLELLWLWRTSENQRLDPIRTVSGAAIFFVAAAPVAMSAPDLVDRVGGFWERLLGGGARGGSGAMAPARLLINGEQRPLELPRVRLGRYPNNEIVLDHSTVSAYHAEIIQRPDGRHEIVDRESRNGTRVNGALVRSQALRDGDLITLGAASMHYLSESPYDPQAGAAEPYDEYESPDPRDARDLRDPRGAVDPRDPRDPRSSRSQRQDEDEYPYR
jgi:hypothetical protein